MEILGGQLPRVQLLPGREIHGRIVDATGAPVSDAIVRFQSNTEDLSGIWDSWPLQCADSGEFSLRVPREGKAAGVVYPREHAPRFIDFTDQSDQGDVVVADGVRLRGRVLDAAGKGLANTVVGLRCEDHRELFAYLVVIGSAVKTEQDGNFELPPLDGRYQLSVKQAAPVYAQRMQLFGAEPPEIEPFSIDTNKLDSAEHILLRE